MIILDKPYVSKFLEKTVIKLNIPVLENSAIKDFKLNKSLNIYDNKKFKTHYEKEKTPILYSNSENSINWITNNLSSSELPKKIEIFKNKVKFRKLIKEIYPDLFYKEISLEEIDNININDIEMPFIIKPSVGFFSLGVYKVHDKENWKEVKGKLKKEIKEARHNYPVEVIDTDKFIIEEYIEGDEFAVDLYFDKNGEPVILNILKHLFSSSHDVTDRIYITSKKIIEKYKDVFLIFLKKLSNLIDLKGFPMHVEFRVDSQNKVVPIEVNPMRFAGWCTTDIAYHAYGINIYEYFFEQKRPNWEEILKSKADLIYSIVIADIPRDIKIKDIKSVDYKKFTENFENPLELREIDYKKHGVFAFLFSETNSDNWGELDKILKSDLREYLNLKKLE